MLTSNQVHTLQRIAAPVSGSMQRKQYPGWPSSYLDMRSVEALERRGLIESAIHKYKQGIRPNAVVCYVITDAGREALAAHSD